MRHGSLFSGIGGFDLAAEWMGWENVFHCEWNPFGQKVLNHYWPKAISYHDITKTDFTIHRGTIDIITGGFPCQPYSMAGKRKGKDDERHLWPQMLRAIREVQPRWVVGENVLGLVNWNGGLVFHEVQTDLEAEGYEVWPYVLPACAVNAPHRRDRVWFVAYSDSNSRRSSRSNREKQEQHIFGRSSRFSEIWPTPYPDGNTKRPSGKSGGIESNRGENIIQPSKWGGETELNNRPSSFSRPTPHTDSNGLNWSDCQHEVNASEGGEYALGNIEQGNGNGDVADTDGLGLRGEGDGIGESGFISQKSKIGDWQNFPTQSPVCTRDDGLSIRLDGITFSKWRNESIKAAGNAIVPQVVFQIFKAIDYYDRSHG